MTVIFRYLSLNQYGWKGGAGSVMIDELRYNYLPNSNKLRNVYDFQQGPHSKLGDFKYSVNYIQNKSHNLTQDYWFDANGNMVNDRNKEIAGYYVTFITKFLGTI